MMNNELTDEITTKEITADEEMGALISLLEFYTDKPDQAAKYLPHLLSLVSSAVAELKVLRESMTTPSARYVNKSRAVGFSTSYQPLCTAQQPESAIDQAGLIYKFYERYPLENFRSDSERAEAMGYFRAGAELQCYGDFITYEDSSSDE